MLSFANIKEVDEYVIAKFPSERFIDLEADGYFEVETFAWDRLTNSVKYTGIWYSSPDSRGIEAVLEADLMDGEYRSVVEAYRGGWNWYYIFPQEEGEHDRTRGNME